MMKPNHRRPRRGTILPMVAVCLVSMIGCVALAVDVGLVAVARTELQDAADAAALAGARALDGQSANNNSSAAIQMARNVAELNWMIGNPIVDADVVQVQVGVYRYNGSTGFDVYWGAPSQNENYGALQIILQKNQPTFFAQVFGVTSVQVKVLATAVCRPRDVAIILDFSSSMQFASPRTFDWSTIVSGSPLGLSSQSLDPVFPRFGPWSLYTAADPSTITVGDKTQATPNSPTSPMQSTVIGLDPTTQKFITDPISGKQVLVDYAGETHAPSNLTYATNAGNPIIQDFSYVVIDSTQNPPALTTNGNAFYNPQGGTYNPLSTASATVTPAPADLCDQNCAIWNANANFGDRWKLKTGVSTPAAQTVGTFTPAIPPSSYAKNVFDMLTFAQQSAMGPTPLQNSQAALNAAGAWEDPSPTGGYGSNFKGYTMGPGYYGKTFYIWPPDPRTPSGTLPAAGAATPAITNVATDYVPGDWRKRFFVYQGASTRMDDNSKMWDTATGQWMPDTNPNSGANNYRIDYNAVLKWITSGPQVFPPSLRSGRVLYYSKIPTSINTGLGLHTDPTDPDELFWKKYIDEVIQGSGNSGGQIFNQGLNLFGMNKSSTVNGTMVQAWGNNNYGTVNILARSSLTGSPKPYMRYDENPVHPRLGFWFGPLSMLCFIYSNGNMLPGTCHESQCWQLKAGIQAALKDIQKNHPNDLAALIYFSADGHYAVPRHSLSNKYTDMENLLWYPFSIPYNASPMVPPATYLSDITQEVRPYKVPWGSLPVGIIPNANSGTGPDLGFMLAFNEFSSVSGYTGRVGASKMCIFETDGVPHNYYQAGFTGGGPNKSYYPSLTTSISISDTGTVNDFLEDLSKRAARDVVRHMCMADKNNWSITTDVWGSSVDYYANSYSNGGKTARVHCIAFGDMFETAVQSPMRQGALNFLSFVQVDGNTTKKGPASGSFPDETYAPVISLPKVEATTALEDYKIINGNAATRIDKIRQALERIMQGDVALSLVQ